MMKNLLQDVRVVVELLALMPCRYWHRLLIFSVGAAVFRVSGVKLFDGIRLPFEMVTALGTIGSPCGLRFLAEIAGRHIYSGFGTCYGDDIKTLYDVGANCGFFSLIRCREAAELHAYCFEPHPITFRTLETNIRINGLQDRVIPINAAAGSHTGTLSMAISSTSSMATVLCSPSQEEDLRGHTVQACTLDDFAKERNRPDAIKIDVEGHEEQVLLGASDVLATTKELVVEVHSRQLESRCRALLSKSGFRIVQKGSLLFCDRAGEQRPSWQYL